MKNIYFSCNGEEYYLDPNSNKIYPKIFEYRQKNDSIHPVKLISVSNEIINFRKTTQLTLIITENCNIRCSYCAYSGQYDNMREHNNNVMNYKTAIKAIDIYLRKYIKDSEYIHEMKPKIGFFGGEPLLAFKLIKQLVAYIDENYNFQVDYTITTNGILLNEEKLNYLLNKNFLICISINGDQKNNDRLRTFSDGRGTYNQLKKLMNEINKLSDAKKKNISLMCITDIGSDLYALNDFFDTDLVKNIRLARVNGVNADFTNWYDQYDEFDYRKYRKQFEYLLTDFKNRLKNNIEPTNFQKSFFNGFVQPIVVRLRLEDFFIENYFLHGSPCIPGDKYAVNPSGDILMCERVNYSGKIGHINNGVSNRMIKEQINKFNIASKKCIKCSYRALCVCCYANVLNDKGEMIIYHQERCNQEKRNIKLALRVYLEILSVKSNYTFGIDKEYYE